MISIKSTKPISDTFNSNKYEELGRKGRVTAVYFVAQSSVTFT